MADFGWVGDLNDNFVSIGSITEIYFNLDADGELNFIFVTTNDGQNFQLYDLPHVGDVVSTPDGNVTMTLQDAIALVQSTAEILESFEVLSNQEFNEDILEKLGKL